MGGKLAGLRRRLEKAEKVLAETAEGERLADCICKVRDVSPPTIAFSNKPEEFEAENEEEMPRPWIPPSSRLRKNSIRSERSTTKLSCFHNPT